VLVKLLKIEKLFGDLEVENKIEDKDRTTHQPKKRKRIAVKKEVRRKVLKVVREPTIDDNGGRGIIFRSKTTEKKAVKGEPTEELYTNRAYIFSLDGRSKVYKHEDTKEVKEMLMDNLNRKFGRTEGLKQQWTEDKRKMREEENGDESYGVTPERAVGIMDPITWKAPCQAKFEQDVKIGRDNKQSFMNQYRLLIRLEEKMRERGCISIRSLWLVTFPAKCHKRSDPTKKYTGCGKCDGCFDRFAQVLMCIKSCSGVGDVSTLMHWGALYISKRFRNFKFNDWCDMTHLEYATVANSCSCACMNACYVLPILRKIRAGGRLPSTLEEIIVFYGMGLKSAALIINAVYGVDLGISCDRHLFCVFKKFGWSVWQNNPTRIALAVMEWLDKRHWGRVNDLLAGFQQLLSDDKVRPIIEEEARNLDQRAKKDNGAKAEQLVKWMVECVPKKKAKKKRK
jgi:hypothetical protein